MVDYKTVTLKEYRIEQRTGGHLKVTLPLVAGGGGLCACVMVVKGT